MTNWIKSRLKPNLSSMGNTNRIHELEKLADGISLGRVEPKIFNLEMALSRDMTREQYYQAKHFLRYLRWLVGEAYGIEQMLADSDFMCITAGGGVIKVEDYLKDSKK